MVNIEYLVHELQSLVQIFLETLVDITEKIIMVKLCHNVYELYVFLVFVFFIYFNVLYTLTKIK